MNNNVLTMVVFIGALFISMFLVIDIMESSRSPISTAILYVGGMVAVIAFFRPKAGMFIITAEAFTSDFLKKAAVYYGNASQGTIMEVMIVVMITVVAVILGMLFDSILWRRQKMSKTSWLLLILGLVWSGLIIGVDLIKGGGGLVGTFQKAFNSGAYLGLAGVIVLYFKDKRSILRLLDFQFILAMVSASWALKQLWFGWADLELFYVETGLSPVASNQYFVDIGLGREPRPTGLASGSKNLGFIAAFCAYGVFRIIHIHKGRFVAAGATVLLYTVLILARFKTAILVGIAAPIISVVYRSRLATLALYLSLAASFILIVFNATYLGDNLEEIDAVSREAVGANSSYSMRTFSTRLTSYESLTDPQNWSFFGLSEDEKALVVTHDMLTGILLNSGAVGIIAIVLLLSCSLLYVHRKSWEIKDPFAKSAYLAFLGIAFLIVASSVAAGNNLHTLPFNLTLWTMVGAMVVFYTEGAQEYENKGIPEAEQEGS